jgi:hypothetical protein
MNHIKNDLHPEKKRNNNKKELVFFKIKFQLGRPPDCLDKWRKELEDYAVPATDASRCCVFACVVDRPVFYFYGENKVDDGNHSYTQETKQQQPLLKNPSLFIFYFSSWIGRQQVFVLPIEAAESFSKWCVCVCAVMWQSTSRRAFSRMNTTYSYYHIQIGVKPVGPTIAATWQLLMERYNNPPSKSVWRSYKKAFYFFFSLVKRGGVYVYSTQFISLPFSCLSFFVCQ